MFLNEEQFDIKKLEETIEDIKSKVNTLDEIVKNLKRKRKENDNTDSFEPEMKKIKLKDIASDLDMSKCNPISTFNDRYLKKYKCHPKFEYSNSIDHLIVCSLVIGQKKFEETGNCKCQAREMLCKKLLTYHYESSCIF